MPNPFDSMVHSKRFWLVLVDAAVSIITLLATRYLSPADVQFITQLIVILQPVVGVLIAAYTVTDVANINAASRFDVAQIAANIASYADNADNPESEG